MGPSPRPEIQASMPAFHGGPNYEELAELGIDVDQVIDFSSNINPLGPSPKVSPLLGEVKWERYPDSETLALRRCLAAKLGIDARQILAGNGSAELLVMVGMAYLNKGDRVVIVGPTFGEYEVVSRRMGAEVMVYRSQASEQFRPNLDRIEEMIRSSRPKITFLCNPNNPTGYYLAGDEVERIVSCFPEALLVLDEAYVPFVENPWCSLPFTSKENVVILRSMTKDYALAGLRLGYAVASPEIVETLHKVKPPWNVNALAQEAGIASLADEEHLAKARKMIAEARSFLIGELCSLDMKVFPSPANFLLVEVGDARSVRRDLLRRGILVRDCASFGLPTFLRLSMRILPECQLLVEALRLVPRESRR